MLSVPFNAVTSDTLAPSKLTFVLLLIVIVITSDTELVSSVEVACTLISALFAIYPYVVNNPVVELMLAPDTAETNDHVTAVELAAFTFAENCNVSPASRVVALAAEVIATTVGLIGIL